MGDIIKSMKNAVENDCYFVFNRFDVYDEFLSPYVASAQNDLSPGIRFDIKVGIKKHYKDFKVLKMTYSNEQSAVIHDVEMKPMEFINGDTDSEDESPLPDIGDIAGGIGESIKNTAKNPGFWATILAIFGAYAGVISIVGVIALAIILFPYYSPFLPAIFDFFKTVFSVIGSWLKSFAKAIQNLFKRE